MRSHLLAGFAAHRKDPEAFEAQGYDHSDLVDRNQVCIIRVQQGYLLKETRKTRFEVFREGENWPIE